MRSFLERIDSSRYLVQISVDYENYVNTSSKKSQEENYILTLPVIFPIIYCSFLYLERKLLIDSNLYRYDH